MKNMDSDVNNEETDVIMKEINTTSTNRSELKQFQPEASHTNVNNESTEILIEEINRENVTESELAEFEEIEPLTVINIEEVLPNENIIESICNVLAEGNIESLNDLTEHEGTLVQKFVQDEAEIPKMYVKLNSIKSEDTEGDEKTAKQYEKYEMMQNKKQDDLQNLPSSSKAKTLDNVLSSMIQSSGEKKLSDDPKRRRVLNAALEGLMGEANRALARGEIELAEKLCFEIIRQNPLAPEPFYTLAEIYEDRDKEKFLKILTIALQLDPSDRYKWIHVAEILIEQGNLEKARFYYSRAIKLRPNDYDMRLRKARLFEMMGDKNGVMYTHLKMIPHIPIEQAEFCLTTAKNVARHFHALDKLNIALEAMQSAYKVCGPVFKLADLNLYIELLMLNKKYFEIVNCLKERTSLDIHIEVVTDDIGNETYHITHCIIPVDYVADIRAKLCVVLIALKAYQLIAYLIDGIHKYIPLVNDRLDLYIDVAEILMQERKYAEALTLLRPITNGDVIECPPFVWLRHGECLRHLNRINEAIESYTRVVQLAPVCYEAKFTLSALLKQQGRHVEAAKALEQSGGSETQPVHARLLYERCIMLNQLGKIDEYLEVGYSLLSRHSLKLRSRQEIIIATHGGSVANLECLKNIPQMRSIYGDEEEKLAQVICKSSSSRRKVNASRDPTDDLSIEDEYELFKELISVAYKQRKFDVAERLCLSVVIAKRFVPFQKDIDRIMLWTCYFNDDCTIAFTYLREMIHKDITNIQLWNLMSLLIQKKHEVRYHRFMSRLVARKPDIGQIRIFLGHHYLQCASYKNAWNIYAPLYKEKPEPMLALCMAVIFTQYAVQKNILRKSAAAAQAIAWAHQYARLRCSDVKSKDDGNDYISKSAAGQEVYYNFGRIYHQVGMLHLAVKYYEKALACRHPLIEKHSKYLSLEKETAFNLHLIYRSANNLRKARQYLYEYCVV